MHPNVLQVRGMMCYERALRVLVRLEHPRPCGVHEADYAAWVSKLVDIKFSYIASVQVYGRCRREGDIRNRWLAKSVDILLSTFPKMKVNRIWSVPLCVQCCMWLF
jgi:1,3-beta-glucan synthase